MALITDNYPGIVSASGPFERTKAVTPSDTDYLSHLPIGVECGATPGIIVLEDAEGNYVESYFAAYQVKRVRPVRIRATNTVGTPVLIHY